MKNLALVLILLAGFSAMAEEELKAPSSVSLEAGRDDAGSTFGSVGADLSLANEDLVFFSAATNVVTHDTTKDKTRTRSFSAGYGFNPMGRWSFTPSVSSWGARSDLVTRSLLLDATINLDNWSFGLQPELKSLVWVAQDNPKKKVRTGASGVHAHLDFLGLDKWLFQLRAGVFNYGGERFQNFIYSYYVTDSAFAQSSGLVKSYGGVSVSYHFSTWTVALGAQNTTYLISGLKSQSVSADLKTQLNKRITVGYGYTSSKTKDYAEVHSNAVNLAVNW